MEQYRILQPAGHGPDQTGEGLRIIDGAVILENVAG